MSNSQSDTGSATDDPRPLEFYWDSDSELWTGHFARGGAGGTCHLDLPGMWLEFDRLDSGTLTKLLISPDLDSDVELLAIALLGEIPPGPPTGEQSWKPRLDPKSASSLADMADLSEEYSAAAEEQGTAAAIFMLEMAAAGERASALMPTFYSEQLPDRDQLAAALERLNLLIHDTTPLVMLAGLEGILLTLQHSDALGSDGSTAHRHVLRRVGDLLRPSGLETEIDSASLEVYSDRIERLVDTGSDPSATTVVRGWRNGTLIAAGLCTSVSTSVPFVSVCGVPLTPDRVSCESPPWIDSFRAAHAAAADARRSEGRGDAKAAELWALVAERWLMARSRWRASAAFSRAASLAPIPSDRHRYRQLALTILDPHEPKLLGTAGEHQWVWWSSWDRSVNAVPPEDLAFRDRIPIDYAGIGWLTSDLDEPRRDLFERVFGMRSRPRINPSDGFLQDEAASQ